MAAPQDIPSSRVELVQAEKIARMLPPVIDDIPPSQTAAIREETEMSTPVEDASEDIPSTRVELVQAEEIARMLPPVIAAVDAVASKTTEKNRKRNRRRKELDRRAKMRRRTTAETEAAMEASRLRSCLQDDISPSQTAAIREETEMSTPVKDASEDIPSSRVELVEAEEIARMLPPVIAAVDAVASKTTERQRKKNRRRREMYRKAEMRRRSTAETEAAMEAARLHSRLEKIETELQLAKDRLAIAETDGFEVESSSKSKSNLSRLANSITSEISSFVNRNLRKSSNSSNKLEYRRIIFV